MSKVVVRSPLAYRVLLMSVLLCAVVGSILALLLNSAGLVSMRAVIEARSTLGQFAAGEHTEQDLTYAAIGGMVSLLDDDYAAFVPPELGAEFQKQLTGNYVGIGAYIRTDGGWLTIVSPIEGSPAFRGGLMPGDRVLSIDGETTQGKSADECVLLLTGEAGEPVDLEVERIRSGEPERLTVTLVREPISTRSVTGLVRDPEDRESWVHRVTTDTGVAIGYARLSQFQESTASELRDVIRKVKAETPAPDGFVLDLRGNPGGSLVSCIEVCEMFMDEGLIVSMKGRGVGEDRWQASVAADELVGVPVVVLIDGQSASASEIVAGALSATPDAVALGTRSFGKGTVQGVVSLRTMPGAQLKFTEAFYYVSDGNDGERNLNRSPESMEWGVDPSLGMFVELTDEQRTRVVEARNRAFALGEVSESDVLDPVAALQDPQIDAAVRAIRLRVESGEWQAVGEDAPDGEALAADEAAALWSTRSVLSAQIDAIDERLAGRDDVASVDLLPDDVDLVGGRLEVFDADGSPVGTLRVTRQGLEQWLRFARVEVDDPAAVPDTAVPDVEADEGG